MRSADDGAALSGATLAFEYRASDMPNHGARFVSVTAASPRGQYLFDEPLPEGLMRIEVSAPGHDRLVAYRNHWRAASCDGAPCAQLDFELWPTGVVHELLPDMVPDPSNVRQVNVDLTNECDDRDDVSICLRVAVGAANMGHGDLFITAAPSDLGDVTQHVFDSVGAVVDRPIPGSFEHHEAHNHIHFGGWARLALRRIDDSCDTFPNAERCVVRREGEKISFCLRNSVGVDSAFVANRLYDCVIGDTGRVEQGISAGYMDVYSAEYYGQMIDVTGLPNGEYWLETTLNPDGVALEADTSNNVTRERFTLDLPECGDGVIDFPESCEGAELGGVTCESQDERFVGGELACNDTCGFDRSGCDVAACAPIDVGSGLGTLASGSNAGLRDTSDPAGCATPNGTGRDVAFSWTAPRDGTFRFVDARGQMMIYVRDGSCGGTELACLVERVTRGVEVSLRAGQGVVVVLDTLPGATASYALAITEVAD